MTVLWQCFRFASPSSLKMQVYVGGGLGFFPLLFLPFWAWCWPWCDVDILTASWQDERTFDRLSGFLSSRSLAVLFWNSESYYFSNCILTRSLNEIVERRCLVKENFGRLNMLALERCFWWRKKEVQEPERFWEYIDLLVGLWITTARSLDKCIIKFWITAKAKT